MRRGWMVAGVVALGLAGVAGAQEGDEDGSELPSCIEVEGIARYRAYGYDHVVRVTNGCDARARCQVWTDVTPEKRSVTVEAHAAAEVVTRTGSPARELTPRARCELDD